MSNAIRKEITRSPIQLVELGVSKFQKKGTLTAQIKQMIVVKSFYPSIQPNKSENDSLFSDSEFDIETQPFTSTENRTAFIPVPDNLTAEDVIKRLAEHPDAVIWRRISNHPILADEDKRAISNGISTKDVFANKQITRFGKGNEKEGQIITDENDKPQYRRLYFSFTPKDDEDLRTPDPHDFYESPEIHLELTGEMEKKEQVMSLTVPSVEAGQTV